MRKKIDWFLVALCTVSLLMACAITYIACVYGEPGYPV